MTEKGIQEAMVLSSACGREWVNDIRIYTSFQSFFTVSVLRVCIVI